MRLILWMLALLAWQSPALASAVPTLATDEAARINAEMVAYGQWLVRIGEIEAPVQREMASLSQNWDAAMSGPGDTNARLARFLSTVERAYQVLDAAEAQLTALELPEFPLLDLSEDVRPSTILGQTRRLNREVRSLMGSFVSLVSAAGANDLAGVLVAGRQMRQGLRLLLESQALMIRASLATVSQEESTWEIISVQLLYFQISQRVLEALPDLSRPNFDAQLPRDLEDFAVALERAAEAGTTKLDREVAEYEADLIDAERRGDRSAASILRRTIALMAVVRQVFPLALDLATLVRAEAGNQGRMTPEGFSQFFLQLHPLRARLEAIITEENAAMASAN
ncbi:MAG: hypothetical protein ACT4N8_10775 [Sphingosinicella sp.]|uniref:hypothetical protein n=1 Tax=Sphingosinicella sp. TaxID=1917971 RepID=UPI00403812D0